MKLPFLEDHRWPTTRETEERVVNPSHDTQLQDHLMDELMIALEKRDAGSLRSAIMALVHSIQNEDQDEM